MELLDLAVHPVEHPFLDRLVWLNVLSLDAPLVAVSWLWLVGRSFGVKLEMTHFLILGLSVWVVYVLDRWLDGFRIPAEKAASQRRRFAIHHRRGLASLIVGGSAATSLLAFWTLGRIAFRDGLCLLFLVILYFLGVHVTRGLRAAFPKEAAVSLIFTLGVFLFIFAAMTQGRSTLLMPALDLSSLFLLNCLAISIWEEAQDLREGERSLALNWPAARGWLEPASVLVVLLSVAFICTASSGRTFPIYWCVIISSLSTWLLHRRREALSRDQARVLADVVLLTPVLIMIWSL